MNTPAPPRPSPDFPADLERTWRTADGQSLLLRPLRRDDLERELQFIRGLSGPTLYQRTQYAAREVPEREAQRLLDLDYHDTMAIAALLPDTTGGRIVGVSRYARNPGTDVAECAIVVADEWQGRGLGTELMRSLAVAATQRGIRWLEGSSLAENTRVQQWARRFGCDAHTEPNSGGLLRVRIDLASIRA